MSIYGGIGGLNVSLPKVDRYSPATKEAVTAASGGAIKIPEYDVAEGFSQTEDYYNTVGQYKNFLAEAQKRGIDPTIPQIGSEEGQLAYQLHNEFINDINRKGRQLKQAKDTQNRLIQGGYRMPIGEQLETGQDVGSFMEAAPTAMKRGMLLPQVQSYTKAISSDRIQPEQIQQYEQMRDKQAASVEAMRPTLAKRYGEAQADEIIAENIAALNTPIPVRYPTEVELANLELRRQGLDIQRVLANMRIQEGNKKAEEYTELINSIPIGGRIIDTDWVGSGQVVTQGGFDFPPTNPFRGITTIRGVDKESDEAIKADKSKAVTNFNRIDIVPITENGKIAGAEYKGKVTLKPVVFGDATIKKDRGGRSVTNSYPVLDIIEPSQLGKIFSGMTGKEQEVYKALVKEMLTQAGGTTQAAPTTSKAEAKTVSRATLRGLLNKAGYEGQTEQSLIDYYKENGYTIK